MTRPKAAELSFQGINRDQIPGIVPPDWWTDGRNVYFKAGKTCRTPGEAAFASSGRLKQAKFVHFVDVGATQYWIYGGDDGVAATDGTSHWNITPAGWVAIASKNRKYTVGDLNGVPWVNHPEAGPFWWNANTASIMTKLPDWPASWSCQVMRAHKNFLFAGAIDTGAGLLESQVSWSSSADPGQIPSYWVPSPTNDAGDYQVGGPSGPIVDMLSVRDQLLVAKATFMASLQYVGGQYVFEGRDVFPSTGLFATGAWVELGNRVYMITGGGKFIVHDMTSFEDVLYGVLEDYFREQLNWEYPNSCFAYRDAGNGQVCFAYPTESSKACTEAITIEASSGRAGIRDLPSVWDAGEGITTVELQYWDSDSATWQSDLTTWNESASGYQPFKVVFGAGSYGMLEQGKADTQIVAGVATPMIAYASRRGLDGGDIERRKFFDGCGIRIKGQDGDTLGITFVVRDNDDGAEFQTPVKTYTIGTTGNVDFMIDGRLAGVEALSTGGSEWQLSSLIPRGRRSGRW